MVRTAVLNNQLNQPSVVLGNSELFIALAKFNAGDRVRLFRVPTQDFGVVIDCFYGSESSVQAVGWHYQVQLDPCSPSFAHCRVDYGFEEDLECFE